MKKYVRKLVASLLVCSLVMSLFVIGDKGTLKAAEVSPSTKKNEVNFTHEDAESLIPIFEAIVNAPDELLLKGTGEQIRAYFKEQGVSLHVYNELYGENASSIKIYKDRSAWRCALAIGTAIVTVAIPAAKIGKIKKYIKALGGVREAAGLLVGATTVQEKLSGTLEALKNILLTITGIAEIRDHCFG